MFLFRPETATSVSYLVRKLKADQNGGSVLPAPLRVLDLCTGSGCIPLLFHHEFYSSSFHTNDSLELIGVDISPDALGLARENLIHQIAQLRSSTSGSSQQTRSLHSIGFVQADVLSGDTSTSEDNPLSLIQALERLSSSSSRPRFDILISNPPYISPIGFQQTTTRSVRRYEPKIALVPPASQNYDDEAIGDLFYPKLLLAAKELNAKVFLFEVSDMEQAKRVAATASAQSLWEKIEIWRDEPDEPSEETVEIDGQMVEVRGRGHGRSVVAYRSEAVGWIREGE